MKKFLMQNKLIIFVIFVVLFLSYHYINHSSLSGISQNPMDYLPSPAQQYTIKSSYRTFLKQQFLKTYFRAWSSEWIKKYIMNIKPEIQSTIDVRLQYPGWNKAYQHHHKKFFEHIQTNMDLATFPNTNRNAIVIHGTSVRELPTHEPVYENPKLPGEGYPFDYMQVSYYGDNIPVHVSQITKDKQWSFVISPHSVGWIPSKNIAYVNTQIEKQFRTKNYVVANQDDQIILDKNNKRLTKTRIGTLYPFIAQKNHSTQLLIAKKDANDNAVLLIGYIDNKFIAKFPMQINPQKIAELTSHLMGHPYDWGDMQGGRDCSGTTMDIMANFGIWLPHHSSFQAAQGTYIPFAGLNENLREKIIKEVGIPYVSLILLKGHIMLYLGQHNKQLYVLHDVWGLKTKSLFGKPGRYLIGKTVITPITFGKHIAEVTEDLLQSATGIIVLLPQQALQYP